MRSSIPMKFGDKLESDFSFSHQIGYKDFRCPTHWHDCFEVIFVKSGSFTITAGNQTNVLTQGDIAVLPPRTEHSTSSDDSSCETYVFGYTREVIYTPDISILNMKYIEPLSQGCNSGGYVIRSKDDRSNELSDLLISVFDDYRHISYGRELIVRSKILAFHAKVCEHFITDRSVDKHSDKYILEAERYIESNICEDISPSDIAAALHISYSHLARVIRSSLGISAVDLITQMKMNYAEELLLINKDMEITDVASALGFNSASYFARQFKKTRGTSPRSFKKMSADI